MDYSDPVNFVTFGSARLYYESAIKRITDYYPYDGSDAEVNKFLNESLDIERYILKHRYPTTTGYITFARDGYAVTNIVDGYSRPTSAEYIDLKGGPGTGSAKSLKFTDLVPNPHNSSYKNSNIYDEDIYKTARLPSDYGQGTRESNLRANFDDGVTVEFWLKTGSLSQTGADPISARQVIFDSWNSQAVTSADYGRITIELTGTTDVAGNKQNPFVLTVQSGANPPRTVDTMKMLGTTSLHEDLGDWNHYAIRMYNTGSSSEILKAELYVNGALNYSSSWSPYALSHSLEITPTPTVAWDLSNTQYRYTSHKRLQGWWKLEDPAGSYVVDRSGNSRTGSYASSSFKPAAETQYYPGLYIQSASAGFGANTATTTGINIGDASLWNGIIGTEQTASSRPKFTIAAWIRKAADGAGGNGRIIDFGSQDLAIWTTADEAVVFSTKWQSPAPDPTFGNVQWVSEDNALSLNEWTHIAVTYDAGQAPTSGSAYADSEVSASGPAHAPKIYVNGVAQTISYNGNGRPTGSWYGIHYQNCVIGNNAQRNRVFSGSIADFAIWDTILAQEEIQAIVAAGDYVQPYTKISELKPQRLES